MLLTGHLRSLPARSLEDPKTNKKRLWDSLVNFSIKKCFHLGCLGSDSGSSGSQVVGLAAVAAATGPAAGSGGGGGVMTVAAVVVYGGGLAGVVSGQRRGGGTALAAVVEW